MTFTNCFASRMTLYDCVLVVTKDIIRMTPNDNDIVYSFKHNIFKVLEYPKLCYALFLRDLNNNSDRYYFLLSLLPIQLKQLNLLCKLFIVDICISLKSLRLPSYVLLDIVNQVLQLGVEIEFSMMTEYDKITLIILINERSR